MDAKIKLWTACKLGDNDLMSSVIDNLLIEVKKCEELMEQNKNDVTIEFNNAIMNMNDVVKLVNDANEEGNTMLHLAALGGHLKLIWCVFYHLMEIALIRVNIYAFFLGRYWILDLILAIRIRSCKRLMQLRMIKKLEIYLEDTWELIQKNLIIERYCPYRISH